MANDIVKAIDDIADDVPKAAESMNDTPVLDKNPKFHCIQCGYYTDHFSCITKHNNSARHLRGGSKKVFQCDKCEYKTDTSHWNLKMHIMSKHATVEEKSKHKYYCALCDAVFFAKKFIMQHNQTLAHKQRCIINNYDKSNDNLDTIDNELYVKIRAQVKKELLEEIRNKLPELFALI